MRARAAVTALVALACTFLHAADITIDLSAKSQTFEGMGASITGKGIKPWRIKSGAFYQDVDLLGSGFYDTLITQLGMSMARTDIDAAFQATQGNFTVTDGMKSLWDQLKRIKEAADRHGEEIRFICSCWSPPGWMKVSGEEAGGQEAAPDYSSTDCRLKDGYDDELAQHFVAFLQAFTERTGLEYYALSLQNEPAFQEPYSSCVYNGARYTTTLKAVGSALEQAGLNTRLFGAEHMAWAFPNKFENHVRQDAEALGYIDAWAVHGYKDGVETDVGAYEGATPTDKPFWMTETSGSGYGSDMSDWEGAMKAAQNILSYLRDGKMAAWTWWTFGGGGANYAYNLWVDDQPTLKYYVTAQFSRYIRPGARQVQSSSTDGDVQVVAFRHEQRDILAIVLVNATTSAKTVGTITVNGGIAPETFETITSTASSQLDHASARITDQITLPARSVTTLAAGDFDSGQGTNQSRPVRAEMRPPVRGAFSAVHVYSLDGRLLRTIKTPGGEAHAILPGKGTHGTASGVYQSVLEGPGGTRRQGPSLVRF